MSEVELTKKCFKCFGDGVWDKHAPDPEQVECPICSGSGRMHFCYADIPELDEIIAEQASQRTDLSNALEAIWNKVKTL